MSVSAKALLKCMMSCIFTICAGVAVFLFFAIIYESGACNKLEKNANHDYVEVDASDLKNIAIHGYNGYQAREEYLIDRWQTEDGVIAVTIYFEEANSTK